MFGYAEIDTTTLVVNQELFDGKAIEGEKLEAKRVAGMEASVWHYNQVRPAPPKSARAGPFDLSENDVPLCWNTAYNIYAMGLRRFALASSHD